MIFFLLFQACKVPFTIRKISPQLLNDVSKILDFILPAPIKSAFNTPLIPHAFLNGPFQPVLENPIPLLLIAITSFAVSVDSVSK
ncbi:Uncharacterised protein [Acinetobacter baumannii]|nr:Uncharacterised protein [Acinetobacter baumannii]